MRLMRGFTLIELMVTIAVLAIIVTIGIPGFSNLIRNTTASGLSNDMVGAFQFARSEAVNRNELVGVCSGQTVAACGAGWTNGWIVFVVSDGAILRRWEAPDSDAIINQDAGANSTIIFGGDGRAVSATNINMNIDGCTDNEERVLSINTLGRVSIRRVACVTSSSS
ncbi:GspH/FimT family pseudopilin [Neptunomonas phycophila]|uniref:GspH/FimT family pseudopilin n=1 Tax=Neptunomonas phycophila TaxID=1572645 RepID=UPI0015B8FA4F|nr:GspH/FimT family pseudopilin [Neptunomonas phycophila]QLE99416.1 prepilin-type N-terminal cleavage/methylation domain-containing protein [Neptunomonas phycophila]